MGSTVDQQPEGEVVRQSQEEVVRRAKIFQPTQPIPKPICDRSGQPDITQDVIGVQTCLSEETRMSELSKLMIDQGNLINTTSHYKMLLKYIVGLRCSTRTMN